MPQARTATFETGSPPSPLLPGHVKPPSSRRPTFSILLPPRMRRAAISGMPFVGRKRPSNWPRLKARRTIVPGSNSARSGNPVANRIAAKPGNDQTRPAGSGPSSGLQSQLSFIIDWMYSARRTLREAMRVRLNRSSIGTASISSTCFWYHENS